MAKGTGLRARGKRASLSPQPTAPSQAADLLFEIGTEELPAAYLPSLIEQLRQEAVTLFQEQFLPVQRVETFGTPRRLVLIARGLAATQRKPGEEVRGPSKQASYDEQGKPTAALLGFLRSHKAPLSQTKLVASPKGDYVYLVKPPTSTSTAAILPRLLPQLIGSLRAPKTMRWDDSGVRFARPIRWLVTLYGSRSVACTFGRVRAGSVTWIGRPQSRRAVRVTSLSQYLAVLKRELVILDQEERRKEIQRSVERQSKQTAARVAPELLAHGLLEEVTYLVERPHALRGKFDPKYLQLPREVLLASMAKHQRVFAIDREGTLLPQFVAILEGPPRKRGAVQGVIERILNARLTDSLLFWNEDRKRLPLDQMAAALSQVTFHERLGSMADKAVRLRALCEPLADAWQLTEEERGHVRAACQLAKADLVSTMVKEFPTLQGVVGKYYARGSGQPQPVAQAIEEQYLPFGNALPKTLIGSALAIVDKLDTLASYFGIGIAPTGDQDPFGLRRAAQGIVEVAWNIHRPLPLEPLLRAWASTDACRALAPKDIASISNRVRRYLLERLYTFAWPAPPPAVDCIDAVLASPCDDLVDVMDRIVSLQQLNGHPGLLKAAKVIERTHNILKGALLRQPQVDPERLREPLERRLWTLYQTHQERLTALTRRKSYAEATTLFGEVFFEPLHEFFERILVNVPDELLQQNRLALMKAIHTLYTERVADLSKLTVLQQHEESS